MMALLTLTAGAQSTRKKNRPNDTVQTEAQKKKQRDADKAYKSTVDKMPDQKYDPWSKMR